MKRNRVFAYSMGCLAFVLSAFMDGEQRSLGFPDGHLTELARAEKVLFSIFIWISIFTGLWFIFLGWIADRKPIGKRLWATNIFYFLIAVLLLGVDLYLRQHLENGGGG